MELMIRRESKVIRTITTEQSIFSMKKLCIVKDTIRVTKSGNIRCSVVIGEGPEGDEKVTNNIGAVGLMGGQLRVMCIIRREHFNAIMELAECVSFPVKFVLNPELYRYPLLVTDYFSTEGVLR